MSISKSSKPTLSIISIIIGLVIILGVLIDTWDIIKVTDDFIIFRKENNNTIINNDTNDEMNIIHLSFIIGSRNDDYGGNPILRLSLTLKNILLYEWKLLHNMCVEIIVIEWNSIVTNPHIWEYREINNLLKYKQLNKLKYKDINIIFYSIDARYNDRINCKPFWYCPYFEYHAKNVGIRRSKGIWKMIMNIDDLWGQNLLNLIGTSIANNLLNINGIYQSEDNSIEIENISSYINISSVIPVEQILNHRIYQKPFKHCFYGHGNERGKGGDFILIHNDTIYNYFGGGFLEMCANLHLDTEFILRQTKINKLKPYVISHGCGYYHINHLLQRGPKRKRFRKNINASHSNKRIFCNQRGTSFYQSLWSNNKLPNDSELIQTYENTDKYWGIKGTHFDLIQF